jgi:hypothetical protein
MANISVDVKREILEKVKKGESVKVLASQYGISDRSIYGWLRWQVSTTKISPLEYGKLKKENQILKEIVGVLTVELEKTKKKIRTK